jgi:hypothetical protein
MKKTHLTRVMIGFTFAFLLSSCRKDKTNIATGVSAATRTYSGNQLRDYYTLICKITQSTPGFFPPVASRAYGFVGVASYESVVHGIPGASSLYGQLNGLAQLPVPNETLEYNWAISSNTAVAEMMKLMFQVNLSSDNLNKIDSMENANLAVLSAGVQRDIINRSVQFGADVTAAIYQASTSDGGHQAYLDPFQLPYTLPGGAFCWVPTSSTLTPVAPYWGNVKPFILADINNNQANLPITFGTDPASPFYKIALDVYNQVKNNTPDQIAIAKFWADDPFSTCTPTGHSFNILIQLLKENNATLEKSSVAFAKLSIAEKDAFICCWKIKYQYVLLRPVSYIQKYIDPSFSTVIGTPPFPAYVSGHSTEIGAASKIYIDLFANEDGDYNFTDYSQVQWGFTTRSYKNFNEMAVEDANSRFYGGVHYDEDDVEGLRLGRKIGDNVNNSIHWPVGIK